MAGLGTMITSASPEWVLLNAVYHHVLAQSASPEAAKIDIATARQNGRLRLRCTLREYKALPNLRLSPGERPPQPDPTVTAHYPIPPDTRFATFDWERSRAFSPNDPVTRSLYEYLDIIAHRDDVLALRPVETEAETTRRTIALAIIDGHAQGRSIRTADAVRLVENNWNDECAKLGFDSKTLFPPKRDAIDRALGRRKD
jgi:hypothetical protein